MSLIKNLPQNLRPREKLIKFGPHILSNPELAAIILGFGTRKEDVLSIAEKMLPGYSANIITNTLSPEEIAKELSIPITYACKLAALFELTRRIALDPEAYINSPQDVFKRYQDIAKHKKEHLIGIYLNARNKIIHEEVIAIGTVNASLIGPKEVLLPAVVNNAVFFIICHNHPSGDPTPSNEDIQATRKLIKASDTLGVNLLDHIVIGGKSYISLKEILGF